MQTINIKNLLRLGKQQELRPLHFVLANRNKHKFGEIDNVFNVQYHPQLQTSELSFTIYKTVDDKECRLWDKITQRRLLWVKEYQEWFEISVDVDDSEKVIKKNITATALCKAELSQINLNNTEINTEADIARSDYEISTFCNFDNPNASILHRLLKKVPNYKIKHVDEALYNIQRSFSISDDTKIYDFLTGTLSEEIGCLFLFDSNERGIYVYDMETGCLDCGYRDENDFDICPKCGKGNIHKPYGQDTAVFVSKDNLGENIQLTSNAEEVKNCFKVTGGDAKINAAIINNNPNGTNTIYVFDEDTRKDMPDDLVSKIDEYDDLIEEYRTTHTFTVSKNAVTQYNNLISKINSIYADKFSFISDSYAGYSNVITKYYDTFDLELYLKSSMMPAWEQSDKTAQSQIELVEDELKSVSVRDVSIISKSTADSAVLLMVKAIIDTGIYKAEIKNSSLSSQLWTGQIILTNYSDEEDNASSDILTIKINDYYTSFVTQCLQKTAAKTDTAGIKELFNIQNIDDFKSELKKYCLSSLRVFLNAYQSALDVLVNENISNEDSEFYNNFYVPYYEKLGAVEYEIYIREADLSTVSLIQTELQNIINDTQKNLDFENYLGDELWQVFLSYRREDNYSNENYISDGLTNEELIRKANELTQTAYKELIKSSTKQYTITGTLHNLLLIRDDEGNQVFAPILEDFTLGNFIRCKIDGIIYRMRILDVTIDYDNLNSLSITFGDVTKGLKTLSGNISDIIKQSNSIAKSYSAVKRQAKQGEDAGITLNRIKEDGLNSAQYNVFNTFSTFVLDEHGLLGRNYYDVTDQYTPEQLRITGNNIVMTDNNWLSTKLAIGKQNYTLNGNEHTTYGVIADTLVGSQIIGSDIYSDNYTTDSEGNVIQGFNFSKSGDFNLADGRFSYNQKTNVLKLKGVTLDWNSSNAPIISDINGLEDTLNNLTTSDEKFAKDLADYNKLKNVLGYDGTTITSTYLYSPHIVGGDISIGSAESGVQAQITSTGKLIATGAEITGIITATDGSFKGTVYATDGEFTGDIKSGSTITCGENFSVTSDGLLTAKNAMIYGTIYATNGSFKGTIESDNAKIKGVIESNQATITGGTIGGWKITETDIYDSTSSLQAGIGKKETSPAFWAGTSYDNRNNSPFRVNHDGSVYADNITLTGGSIGGWKITETDIYNDVGDGSAGIGTSGGRFAFWAGASYDSYTDAKFRVTHSGDLYASSVDVTGKITATSGKIGGWEITDTWLECINENGVAGLGARQAIYAGSTDSSAAPFHVSYDGSLYSTKGTIGGWKITETELVGNTTDSGTTILSSDGQIRLFAYENRRTAEFSVSPGRINIDAGAFDIDAEIILFGRSFTRSMIDKLLELIS